MNTFHLTPKELELLVTAGYECVVKGISRDRLIVDVDIPEHLIGDLIIKLEEEVAD